MFEQILYAILGAISYLALMYFKKEPRPPFSEEQLALTLLLGIIVGVIQFYTNLSFDAIIQYLVNFGIVGVLESIIKLAWKKLVVAKWFSSDKA